MLLRIATLLALAASMALLIDYTTPAEAFCGADSACAKVRGSGYGYLFNGSIPVPAVGLAGFASLYLLSLWKDSASGRKLLVYAASAGAAVGLFLIVLQVAVVKHLCWLCMVTDISAIVAGSASIMYSKAVGDAAAAEEQGRSVAYGPDFAPWALALMGVIAVAAPALWPRFRPLPPVPPPIAALYAPDKINVVEFFDFECPHCRALHPKLTKAKEPYGEKVNFVRKNYPLAFHLNAKASALGHLCAREQGKGDEYAERMLENEPIGSIGATRTAKALGLDLEKFEACVQSADTQQALDKEMQILRDAEMVGLPTTYIGGRRIIGNQPEDVYVDALSRAEAELKSGEHESGVPAPVYALVCLVAFAGVAFAGRKRPANA
ncbi:MAG: thioredoxin domain-containing protein [Myxococcales bacterium]|nr:thioredoxin domain-containing protein [Myxococcales bacterium]